MFIVQRGRASKFVYLYCIMRKTERRKYVSVDLYELFNVHNVYINLLGMYARALHLRKTNLLLLNNTSKRADQQYGCLVTCTHVR